jgi:nitrile hydratase
MSEEHSRTPTGAALRVKALEALLEEKGLVDTAALDTIIDTFENKVGPRNGARVVAKAWTDPEFRKRLLDNAAAAVGELGFGGLELGGALGMASRRNECPIAQSHWPR